MKTGLILGKFAPLHQGHQALIEAALAETDHLIALIYDVPEVTPIPLPVRADWIKRLYPSVEVIEAWDGPTEVGDTPVIKAMHDEYILRILQGRRIDAFYSAEFYGEHVSRALGAVDRRLPRESAVSGTEIRKRPYELRALLHPVVYTDLVIRVVFLGAPCTGKTTLARDLADRFSTTWMPEYGREYWETWQKDRRLTLEQLVEIAVGHREREDRLAMQANRFLFVDTDATTTSLFSRYYHGEVLPQLREMANECARRYDLFFLCADDIAYDDTWDRSGEVNRAVLQKQLRADLQIRKIPYFTLRGDLGSRLALVSAVLGRFEKFKPLPEGLKG